MFLTRRDLALTLAGLNIAAFAPKLPVVILTTSLGPITIQLRPDRAPLSAADFLKYVDARAYEGGRFFRTVRPDNDRGHPKINVIQGGTRPDVIPAKSIPHETTKMTGLSHTDGTISLTRDAPGTGSGSEFFICVGDNTGLNYGGKRNPDGQGFAAFGHVIAGMETVRQIWQQKDTSGKSDSPYTINQIHASPIPIITARRA